MKRWSASYIFTELQIKAMVTSLCTYQNGWPPKHWQGQMLKKMWSNRNSHSLPVGIQTSTATLEASWAVFSFFSFNKTKHTLTIWSGDHNPWCLSKWAKNLHPQKGCTQMFLATLIIITTTWKQSRYPSVG